MPEQVTPGDRAQAELIQRLLTEDSMNYRAEMASSWRRCLKKPTPPTILRLSFETDVPDFLGQATHLRMTQTVESAFPREIVKAESGALALRCEAQGEGAQITLRLAPGPDQMP